jgi:hypothetical protein
MNGNQVVALTSDGTNYVITGITGVVGQFIHVDVSGSYTASASQCLWVNTTASAVTVTLPAAPTRGDTIRIVDVANTFNTNNLTVSRNGQPIMSDTGPTANLTVATQGAAYDLL